MPVAKTIAERIRESVTVSEDECWIWQKSLVNGYGQMSVGSMIDNTRQTVRAHRASYEAFVGPIPEGLTIDHLCRVRACVNPDHLEPVTPRSNSMRRSAANSGKPLCKRGLHYLTPLAASITGCRLCTIGRPT